MKCLTAPLGAMLAIALAAGTASAGDGRSVEYGRSTRANDCSKCPPPAKYDTQEVVKTTKEVDHSGVIETQSMVPQRRVIETNHLILHENETRNIGTIQHNHLVIEKELVLKKRNVDSKYVNTVVNLVEHKYNTERKHEVEQREIAGVVRDLRECNCDPQPVRAIRAYGMVAK